MEEKQRSHLELDYIESMDHQCTAAGIDNLLDGNLLGREHLFHKDRGKDPCISY